MKSPRRLMVTDRGLNREPTRRIPRSPIEAFARKVQRQPLTSLWPRRTPGQCQKQPVRERSRSWRLGFARPQEMSADSKAVRAPATPDWRVPTQPPTDRPPRCGSRIRHWRPVDDRASDDFVRGTNVSVPWDSRRRVSGWGPPAPKGQGASRARTLGAQAAAPYRVGRKSYFC